MFVLTHGQPGRTVVFGGCMFNTQGKKKSFQLNKIINKKREKPLGNTSHVFIAEMLMVQSNICALPTFSGKKEKLADYVSLL